MLRNGSIPLLEEEWNAVNKLIAQFPDAEVSFTRRDPYNQGPLVVYVGDDIYVVDEKGRRRKK